MRRKSCQRLLWLTPHSVTHHQPSLSEIIVEVQLVSTGATEPLRIGDRRVDRVNHSVRGHPSCHDLVQEPELLVVDSGGERDDAVASAQRDQNRKLSKRKESAAVGDNVCVAGRSATLSSLTAMVTYGCDSMTRSRTQRM